MRKKYFKNRTGATWRHLNSRNIIALTCEARQLHRILHFNKFTHAMQSHTAASNSCCTLTTRM